MARNATVPEASDLGLAAWTMDPATTIVSTALATTVIYLAMLFYRPEFDVAPLPGTVYFPNGVVGTSSAFQVGLVNVLPIPAQSGTAGTLAAGTLLASSAAAGTISAGLNKFTLTYGVSITSLPYGPYWIAMLNTTGTTTTGAAASNAGAANLGANIGFGSSTASMRFATNGTGASLPSTFTLSSNTAAGAGLCLCAGLG